MSSNSEQAYESFVHQLLQAPWGSLAKTEMESLIFELVMHHGYILPYGDKVEINISDSDVTLADKLKTTTARVRALRSRHEQRQFGGQELSGQVLYDNIVVFNIDENATEVGVHSTYLRERFADAFRQKNLAVHRVLARDILKVKLEDLLSVTSEIPSGGNRDWERYVDAIRTLRSQNNWKKALNKTVELGQGGAKLLPALSQILPSG